MAAVDALLETEPETPAEAMALAAAKVVCLVGFPLIPMAVYLSGRHPGLGGVSSAEQISRLAAQATAWAQVHFAFSVGGFLALAAILVLRSEVAAKAPVLWTNAAAAVGVVGAVIFTGTVLMEVKVIPALSRACTASAGCRTPENAIFTDALANEGWRVLPGLTAGGRTMMVGVALLAMLGFTYGSLRTWEAATIFGGAVLEIGTNTGLHQWGNFSPARGMPGLAAVAILVGCLGVARRLIKAAGRGDAEPEPVQAEPAEPV
jgi:hypothetical protein